MRLILAALLLAMPFAMLANVGAVTEAGAPSGNGDPDDQCAQINNHFGSAPPRCLRFRQDGTTFYLYYLATNLNSANACRLATGLPPGSAPSIGLWQESNNNGGLQTGSNPPDTQIFAMCSPWDAP